MPENETLQAGEHRLTYQRRAVAAKDGQDGHLFLHRWSTGFQHLIFQSLSAAQLWLEAVARPEAQYP